MKKKFCLSLILALMLGLACGTAVWAADDELSNDELFAGYLEQQLYGNDGIMLLGTNAADSAFASDPVNKKLYEVLKAKIEEVAAKGGSTVFTVNVADLGVKKTWTYLELGVYNANDAVEKALPVDTRKVFQALLLDCPYEMYWCNKSANNAVALDNFSYGYDDSSITLPDTFTLTFQVGREYQNGNITTVKAAVTDVKAKAQAIVNKYQGQSVYERLTGYKNAICDLVDYDTKATGTSSADGVNPWQIINVFDDDTNTNVVCEGYAKAFQYLCDLDTAGGFECYTVTGEMAGGTGAGPHMWNIVRVNGLSYLVDVTNSDAGSVGMNGELFLKVPTSGNELDGYTFNIDGKIVTFKYDINTGSNMVALWGRNIIKLTDKDYSNALNNIPVENITLEQSTLTLAEGETADLKVIFNPTDATNQKVNWSSSYPDGVTVDENGKVTAIKAGEYSILASTDEGYHTAECDVTVTETPGAVINVTAVGLEPKTAELTVGQTLTLKAIVEPSTATNKAVTWTTSDSGVATVESGVVTAKAVGTATITVTTEDGGKTAACTVNVKEKAPDHVSVTSVTLDKDTARLTEGETVTLTATVTPANATNKNVTWSSSDPAVATVTNGVVTAVKAGTARITVTTADGGKTAVCTVTVDEKKIPVTAVTLDKNTLSLEVKTTAQLIATVVPADATNKTVAWTSSDEKVATVDKDGNITPLAKGTTTITATADGVKAECVVTVTTDTVYTITFDTDGGNLVKVVNKLDYVTKGDKYTMPTASKSGYTLKHWAIGAKDSSTTAKANETYTFTEDTTVYAVWDRNTSGGGHSGGNRPSGGGTTTPTKPGETTKPGTTKPSGTITALNVNNVFADVKNGEWYSEAVAYVYNKGMMNGTEKGFEPNATTTRAMLVTMLYRLEGEPATGAAKFNDVASGQWFSKAIAWASANGVVNGYADGKFGPNDAITREQLAAVLYRFAQAKGMDVSAKGSLTNFNDSAKVSGWANEAMQWAVGAGIINGDNNALKPAGNATRAEVAMMIMRFSENIAK